jgi:hemoglobin
MAQYCDVTEAAIAALVNRFYTKARRDPTIGPVFNAAIGDWDEHLRKLCDFWSSVMLTSGRYKGNPMAAHMQLPIEPHFFECWLALWRETAAEIFAPKPAAAFGDKAGRIAESLKLALFYRPGAAPAARTVGP